jgi:hypothetical protein
VRRNYFDNTFRLTGVKRLPRPYRYALALLVGVLFVTPTVGIGLSAVGLPLIIALLGILTVVIGLYGSAAILAGDTRLALTVSVIVLVTVAANVPLGSRPGGVTIGPDIFLVDVALALLALVSLSTWERRDLGAVHGLLIGYLVWTIALVALAPGPRPDVMGWYVLHVARYVAVFVLVSRAITASWIAGRNALGVVVLTVLAHGVVASVQVVTGPIEQLTVFGFNPRVVASLGPIPTGPYVGGFTGGSPFASLAVIVVPILLALSFSDRIPRILAFAGVGWFSLLLQLTAWDAARGALLVAFCASFVGFGWWVTDVLWSRGTRLARWWRARLFCVRALFPAVALATLWQLSRFRANPDHDPVFLNPELGQATLGSLTVPGFSTKNLSIRLYQYVGGVDVFLQYPLTGLGGANYTYIALAYADRENMIHNFYIGVFAETGLVGGVLLFGAVALVCVGLWVVAESENDPIWLGVLIGLVGFFALQSFQPQYLRPITMGFVFCVLGICYGEYLRVRRTPDGLWTAVWEDSMFRHALESSRLLRTASSATDWVEEVLGRAWRE